MRPKQGAWKLLACLLLMISAVACSQQMTGPQTWIDAPVNGSSVPVGASIKVLAHAYAPEGVAEVLLSVNGAAYRRNPPKQPGSTFSEATLEWFPQQEGDYVLQVTAFSQSGQATSARAVSVKAIGQVTATPVISVTPVRPVTLVPPVTTVAPGAPDLAIVNVEAIAAGFKGTTPFCNTRVTYRNAGAAPIPRDFTIQFYFNGTPQIANTVAGGLPPGASAEITFVYQFEGTPYIGVSLDSTSVIAESNETNNAFAEARLCSGPTPVISVTRTPTRTPTPVTPAPPPPPAGCSGSPNITSFSASPASIQRGQSSTLSWGAVTNADNVSVEPSIGGVPAPGSASVSPVNTTTYTLTARCGNNSVTRQTTIQVSAPPPQPPADHQGPPAPNLRSPKGSLSCRTSVTLDWDAVSDPSGIKNYTVKWTRNDGQTGGTVTTGTSHGISVTCGKSYTWSVQATDNANNTGAKSSASFSIQEGLY